MHTLQVEVNNGKAKTIHRTYHDLLWLHRNLTRRVELGGYIVRKLAEVSAATYSIQHTAYSIQPASTHTDMF